MLASAGLAFHLIYMSEATPNTAAAPPKLSKLSDFLKEGVGVKSVALSMLFLLSVLYTLYFAKEFLLPIFLDSVVTR